MSDLQSITDSNYDSLVQENKEIIIDFYGTWCGPCKMQEKILENSNIGVPIFKCNIDENLDLATIFNIQTLPTLILIKDGEEFERWVGVTQEHVIKEKINNF